MPLAGKQLLPREIAALGAPAWEDVELVKMVATSLGESAGYVGAWHDNLSSAGVVLSRDCGLMQINIAASAIDGPLDQRLRTTAKTPALYEPVALENVRAALALYNEAGTNGGRRRWEPWVAYTTGWATFPAWWTWHQNAQGKPIGPWNETGRYLQRAIVGVANYRLLIAKDKTALEALSYARSLQSSFDVDGKLGVSSKRIVGWSSVPPAPSGPPADGTGPRPVVNHGA